MRTATASSTQAKGRGEYAKSSLTRENIVAAAIPIFGARGLDSAGTREIAEAAGVNQPAINYHFGSKENLYRACAEAIVEKYRQQMGSLSLDAADALSGECSADEARKQLMKLMEGLTEFLVSGEHSQNWVGFIVREMSEQGDAARILHESIWKPGTDLVALLIQASWNKSGDIQLEEARLEALLLVSNLVAFTNGRTVSMQILDWDAIGPAQLDKIKQAMDYRVNDIVRRSSL